MGSETKTNQLPKIDFSGAQSWSILRSQVMNALNSYGCFEAVYPKVTLDIRHKFFDTTKDLFSLPLETKVKNVSNKPFHGYLGQFPLVPSYEALAIMDAPVLEGVQSFTNLMWPDGNPTFSETVHGFSIQLKELLETVMKMVMENLGAKKYYESEMKSTKYLLRVAEYGPPKSEEEKELGLFAHRDKNLLGIICQDQVDGLEIETKSGEWITVVPSSQSLIIVAGDSLRAWTNGRVHSPLHRVLVGGNVTRYSTILFSFPEDDVVVQAPPELIDVDNPPRFKPYAYMDYVRFCGSEEAKDDNQQLDTFCGLVKLQHKETKMA